ncbi:MAG: ROK family protein [Clostridiales bacterium]|jgi:glucokinase|nr:ROK family protein [Clostridiales bacterium]
MKIFGGIDIGGTKCATVLARTSKNGAEFLSRREIPTVGSYEAVLDTCCRNLLAQIAGAELIPGAVEGIGISCGGPLDAARGRILSPPNLPGWDDVPVTDIVAQKTGIAARLKNDADACAVAEWKYGAGAGAQNMIFLTFGTGLGAGLILGGGLYSGACGMAGELGHWRMRQTGAVGYGKAGSLEGFCSGGGLSRTAALRYAEFPDSLLFGTAQGGSVTAKDIAAAARAGDRFALELMRECGEVFGLAASYLIDLLNPELIVAGGVFMRAHDLILPYAQAVIDRECLPQTKSLCRILPSALGERIGDYGAICAF